MFIAIDRLPKSADPLLGYLVDSSSRVIFPLYSILGTLVALSSLVKVCPVSTRIYFFFIGSIVRCNTVKFRVRTHLESP